ncbi:protein huluwa [Chanos chanos]|uniref:Protein huluwa n=1 Tax=Chanos chanos TaxID=29144 RepID=A0A6J2UUN8_CHACN|nr:protein huluwa-like [Chanos chanos]
MSHLGTTVLPSGLHEGYPVSSLTVLILLLIPCIVLLLVLNCLLLGYKLIIFTRRRKTERSSTESGTLLHSSLSSTRQRITRFSDGPSLSHQSRKTNYASVSEPMLSLPAITSSLTSSAERRATGQRWGRLARPDGATCAGSGSLRVPSTLLLGATSSSGSTRRAGLPRSSRSWRRSAPVLVQSSDSEAGANAVPPNSPEFHVTPNGCPGQRGIIRRNSTMVLPCELESPDKVHVECEFASSIPPETSCVVVSANSSAAGPGLDSDFGASAGVSLRILSADSDGFPGSALASGLEWDYYDPSYVTQNHVPKHRHHAPPITTKQYWV